MVFFGGRELIEILRPFFFFGNGPFFKKRFERERVFFFFANRLSLKTRFECSKEEKEKDLVDNIKHIHVVHGARTTYDEFIGN
jgi:hypothetical protein